MTPTFAFEPFPPALYSADDLMAGFHLNSPPTYVDSVDFKILREYVSTGGSQPTDYLTAIMRALHDTTITQHLADKLQDSKAIAIMGSHSLPRASDGVYAETAVIASKLADEGFTILSGGGPGAMEAAHLGAMFSGDSEALHEAICELVASGQTQLPDDTDRLVGPDGTPNVAVAEALAAGSVLLSQYRSEG